jgi:hypothetical protein
MASAMAEAHQGRAKLVADDSLGPPGDVFIIKLPYEQPPLYLPWDWGRRYLIAEMGRPAGVSKKNSATTSGGGSVVVEIK